MAFGAGQIDSTYANRNSLSGLQLALGYGMGGAALAGATGSSLTLSNFQASNAGTYAVPGADRFRQGRYDL